MLEEDWDNEVNETQDEFNTSKFDSIEAQKKLESEDFQHKKEKQQAIQIKREAEEDPYGFTAKRNAMKAAEQNKIKSNPVKKVPPVTVEEEVPVPIKPTNTAAGAKISKVGSTGPSKSRIVDPALKAFFEESESKTFSEQAIDFLNAYWPEVGDQAEFIFSAAHKMFVHADMHTKGITLHHLYTEGNAVDYNVAAYFYEKLYHFLHSTKEGKVFRDDPTYAPSMIEMKTAIQLKEDFREKVDVSFDGKISFLEHLLYQYNNVANPRDYMMRRQAMESEHEVIRKAREALEDINEQVRKYEEKRKELEEGSKQPGVKGKSFQHQLSMLDASPLAEALQKSLITAEAAVRLAVKHFKGQTSKGAGSVPEGSLWWMKRELKAKKEVVVPNTLRRIKAA